MSGKLELVNAYHCNIVAVTVDILEKWSGRRPHVPDNQSVSFLWRTDLPKAVIPSDNRRLRRSKLGARNKAIT
jgi:hypothetical protein